MSQKAQMLRSEVTGTCAVSDARISASVRVSVHGVNWREDWNSGGMGNLGVRVDMLEGISGINAGCKQERFVVRMGLEITCDKVCSFYTYGQCL